MKMDVPISVIQFYLILCHMRNIYSFGFAPGDYAQAAKNLYIPAHLDHNNAFMQEDDRPSGQVIDNMQIPMDNMQMPMDNMERPMDNMQMPIDDMEMPVQTGNGQMLIDNRPLQMNNGQHYMGNIPVQINNRPIIQQARQGDFGPKIPISALDEKSRGKNFRKRMYLKHRLQQIVIPDTEDDIPIGEHSN